MTKMSSFLYWLWWLTCMTIAVDAFVITNNGRPAAFFSPIVHSTFFAMQHLNGDDENSMSDLVEEIWIEEIWIEDEEFEGEIWIEDAEWPGGWKVVDPDFYENVVDNCVFVTLKNGKKFWAAFYTYSSIEWLAKRHQRNGDYLGGKYFQDERMILIDRCSRKDIEDVVHGILKENNGTLAPEFARIDPWWYPRKLWSTVSFEVTYWLQEAVESTFSRTPLATWKGEGLPLRRFRKRLRRRRERLRRRRERRQNKNSSS